AGPGASGDGADPEARQESDGADQQQDHQRRRQPVLREQPQQLGVEGRPRAGGRRQAITGLAHMLNGGPPTLGRRPLGRRRSVQVVGTRTHVFYCYASPQPVQKSRKILKSTLKGTLKTAVNERFPIDAGRCLPKPVAPSLPGEEMSMKLYDGGRAPNP